jgi:hypothetical protein
MLVRRLLLPLVLAIALLARAVPASAGPRTDAAFVRATNADRHKAPPGHRRTSSTPRPTCSGPVWSRGWLGEGLARWRLLRFQPLPIQPCMRCRVERRRATGLDQRVSSAPPSNGS